MIVPNPIPTKSLNNIKDMNSEIIKNVQSKHVLNNFNDILYFLDNTLQKKS